MADPNAKFRDIIRSNVRDSAQRLLKRLSGRDANARELKGKSIFESLEEEEYKKETSFPKRIHSRSRRGRGSIVG